MILSDKTIRSLCVTPQTYFDHEGYNAYWENGVALPLGKHAADEVRRQIREMFVKPTTPEMREQFKPMITPFIDGCIRQVSIGDVDEHETLKRRVLSYGLSSYGYDVRLTQEFKIFTNANAGEIDPKRLNVDDCLVDGKLRYDEDGACYVMLPPNSYLLARTVEYFDIPRDVMVVCVGKSTYARAGAIVNVTPIEPGFKGNVVIEVSNSTNLPMRIYADEGIAQFLFFRGDEPCETSYDDRSGKYQGQTGIQMPVV